MRTGALSIVRFGVMMKSLLAAAAALMLALPAIAAPPSYVGTWAESRASCRAQGDAVPIQIREHEIEFYESACDLGSIAREGDTWTATAKCGGEGETWTDRIRMTVSGNTLVFVRNDEEGLKFIRCR